MNATPPTTMDDITIAYEGLTEELMALREGFGCDNLSMMCEFYDGLKTPYQKLLEGAGKKKMLPKDFAHQKRMFWANLRLLATSLDEQRNRLKDLDVK